MEYSYSEVYNKLSIETCIVTFRKKDGTVRVMLATRNLITSGLDYGLLKGLLDGHDKRCNIRNGNIGVIDLTIGEGRAFNIERILDIIWLGDIRTKEDLDRAFDKFMDVKNSIESTSKISMDSI